MDKKKEEKTSVVYEGHDAEAYKYMRSKWIKLAIVGTGLPFLITCVVSVFGGVFKFSELFTNGEIVLSLFSLTIPMIFDLFEIKEKYDEVLDKAFTACIIVVCFQVLLYGLIKMSVDGENFWACVIVSLLMILSSWIICMYSIKAMFNYSLKEEDENNE